MIPVKSCVCDDVCMHELTLVDAYTCQCIYTINHDHTIISKGMHKQALQFARWHTCVYM